MLTAIRDRATGWIAWVIVILITIPFALWGIQSYFEGGTEIPVATVNDSEISLYEYQNELSRQRQSLAQRLGGNFDPALLDSLGIKSRVIDGLIENRLVQEYIQNQNFRISDEQLSQLIASNPAFLQDGKFSQELYLNLLSANGLSPQGFEESQRQQGASAQLQSAIINSGFSTNDELERLLALDGQSRQVDYVLLKAEDFESEFEADDAEIEQFYKDNIDNYQAPARIKVNYVELSVEALTESVEPSEEDIQSTFEQTSGRYRKA